MADTEPTERPLTNNEVQRRLILLFETAGLEPGATEAGQKVLQSVRDKIAGAMVFMSLVGPERSDDLDELIARREKPKVD